MNSINCLISSSGSRYFLGSHILVTLNKALRKWLRLVTDKISLRSYVSSKSGPLWKCSSLGASYESRDGEKHE